MWKPTPGGVADGLIGSVIVAAVSTTLAYASTRMGTLSLTWPLAVGFGIVVAAGGLVILDKFLKYRRGLPWSNNKIESRLKRWLEDSGWALRPLPPQAAAAAVGTKFAFSTEDPQGRRFVISRSGVNPDALMFGGRVIVNPSDQAAIQRLSNREKDDLTHEIVAELMRLGVSFQMEPFPTHEVIITHEINLREQIRNAHDFARVRGVMARAINIVVHLVRRAVARAGGEPSDETGAGPPVITQ